MTDGKLTLAQFVEGGLALLLSRPLALGIFIPVYALISYGSLWAEVHYSLSLWLSLALSIGLGTLASGMLVLALGDRLREVLTEPVELFVRLAFVLAATLLVVLGSMVAGVFFLIPGLYVAARWSLASPLVLLSGAGVIQSLVKSWELTEQSAWSLVGVIAILWAPALALGLFGSSWIPTDHPPSAGFVIELVIGSGFAAFEAAVFVFALRTLAPEPDGLAEVFA